MLGWDRAGHGMVARRSCSENEPLEVSKSAVNKRLGRIYADKN
jgi:hypothetical protein